MLPIGVSKVDNTGYDLEGPYIVINKLLLCKSCLEVQLDLKR